MRASLSAVYFARDGRQATMDAARHIAALTYGDPAAWEGTAIPGQAPGQLSRPPVSRTERS